jgi:hypothetical protein
MTDAHGHEASPDAVMEAYAARCTAAWQELFFAARGKEEMQFAMALNPEFRGMQDAGWSTAEEASRALDQYLEILEKMPSSPIKVRLALSLYSHLSEASGFYEVPKNMMRIASGEDYNVWPFRHLVARHAESGAIIAPNANKVMKDLLGHAQELGLQRLKAVIIETFDPDLRNGYAHADYIIWNDGIRLRKRNGGYPFVVSFDDFTLKLNKAITFFQTLKGCMMESVRSYATPKRIKGRMNNHDPVMPAIISYDEATEAFSIQSGLGL